MAIGGMIFRGGKWIAKKIATQASKRRKAKALKIARSPSKLSKSVTKHSKAQKKRAQVERLKGDMKVGKFPTAKKIEQSGIKLKDLDTKKHSRKGMTQVKYKPKDKLNKGVRTAYSLSRRGTYEGKHPWQQAYNAKYDSHPRHYWKKSVGLYAGSGLAAKIWYDAQEKTRKKRKASKPYSQKTPVRGIQLGAPGTQSGTSRSKRKYKKRK